MNKFYNAMNNRTVTENGMATPISSGNSLVDLFFKMGGSRQMSSTELERLFKNSFEEYTLLTVRAMFYNRDIRGGQGERRSFRIFLKWLAENQPETCKKVLKFVPEYGRWDDLFAVFGTRLERDAINLIGAALAEKNKLAAKWMPRENKKNHEIAKKLMISFGLSPKNYRKLLAGNTEVVENLMCKKQWDGINYSHVPSVASNRYRKAFMKNDGTRYAEWVEDVKAGKNNAKVNASAIFPHNIVERVYGRYVNQLESDSIDEQWKALPDYVPEGKSFLPVCDVSGSMSGEPMMVSISLGIYLAERNKGDFKNLFMTFSSNPTLELIRGKNLYEKVHNLNSAHWDMNTNLEKAFQVILSKAVNARLKQEDLPSALLIISDMQFDQCIKEPSDTAMEMIERMYENAGYKRPDVVFWNVRSSIGVPTEFRKNGTALVSGFSPSIMKTVLSGEMNPLSVVLKTLNSDRYSVITV